jgi:mono/diheme cytochrome c family protein
MITTGLKRSCLVWSLALVLPALAQAADTGAAGATADTVVQGHTLFMRYCSACHGESGTGDGVISGFMRPQPTNLTLLAQKAGGTFNAAKVVQTIDGRQTVRAHGDADMPVWGEILAGEQGPALDRETVARTKVVLITDYLAPGEVMGRVMDRTAAHRRRPAP